MSSAHAKTGIARRSSDTSSASRKSVHDGDRWAAYEDRKAVIEATAQSAAEYESRLSALVEELGL